ncbi:pep-2 [Clostera anastomosis granulovirus A]|uniref:Pep-2 n=1 Tax=Clostera anastomosis granulovirus A TaxID=1986289 RepID=U5KB41_9BBAC|nr:pep-2 [Clostera anastomosis granulovirus Henan]AGQ20296.1 pep-2 [Clostera anastomosis granulovirus Henan]
MSSYSCLFSKTFDGVNVPLLQTDMVLWVGADEVLRILKLSPHYLQSLPESEKSTLKNLESCSDSTKLFITALGVGLLSSRLVNRGAVIHDVVTNDNHLPERVNAFANIFLTDVIVESRQSNLLCGISKKQDAVLDLLNEPVNA